MIWQIYNLLLRRYGEQGWWPISGIYNPEFKHKNKSYAEKFEISVGAILTQSTSWKNVEKALQNLRNRGVLSREGIIKLSTKELAEIIRPSGYHNQKALKLKAFAEFKGKIARDSLLNIRGIGPETADSILLYAYNIPVFVIDAYTRRIFSRINPEFSLNYDELQSLFHSSLPHDSRIFNEYHALIVKHAKQHCRKNPVCSGCPLLSVCEYGKPKEL